MMKFKYVEIFIVFIICITFVGCGFGDNIPTVTPTHTPIPEHNNKLNNPKTINVIMPSEINSTNPLLIDSRDVLSIYNLIFEPFVGKNDVGEPVPALAKTWKVDESGTRWTLVLRDDVQWQHTGREINADDVFFTLELMNKIKDDSIHCKGMGYIRSWDVIDEKTITITSFEPFYGVLTALNFLVLPYDVGYNELGAGPVMPVGTGPYIVSEFNIGEKIVLIRNENWWQSPSEVETIIAQPYDINEIAVSALSLGQLDVVQTEDITVSQLREAASVNTHEYNTNYYEFLMPNIGNSGLLRDNRVRQAIALAINKGDIISNVYINHAIACESPVQPSSWLYEGTSIGYSNDVDEALRLMTLSGWKKLNPEDPYYNISPDGVSNDFTLTLITNDNDRDSLRYDAAQIIVKNLAGIGIRVEFQMFDSEMFSQRVKQGYFDLLLAGWYVSDIPDLRTFFSSDGANNLSGYTDDEMDRLLDEVMKQDSVEGLRTAYKKVQDKINEDLPVISLYFRTHTMLTRSRIINVTGTREGDAFSTIQDWELID